VQRRPTQQAAYALLQARQRRQLRQGVRQVDPSGGMLTCVVRLPPDLASKIHELVRDLPGAQQHYVYPASDLHLTVLNLQAGGAAAVETATAVLAASLPFRVELYGLGMSQQSVFVRVFDDGGLVGLRRRLISVTGVLPPWPLRQLGFVNVIRYRGSDVDELTDAVRAQRRLRVGSFEIAEAELVRTDKVLSQAGTTLVATVSLAGGPAG
jgi:hypothetical protein